MRSTRLVAILLVAGIASPAAADPGAPGDDRGRKPFGFRQLRDDAVYLAKKPFDRRGQRKALAIAGATLALYLVRDEIRDHIQEHPSDSLSRWANDARDVFGKGAFAPALALAAYGASFATGNEREKETAFLLLESMAFSAVATRIGAFTLAAERPEDGDSVRLFDTDGRGVSLDVALAASVIQPLRRQYLRVRPGDRFEGWEVSEIEEQRLVLKNRGVEHVFELRDYSKPAPPPPKKTSPRRVGSRTPASARRLPAALNRKK